MYTLLNSKNKYLQVISRLDKIYLKMMQNIKSGIFISINSVANINKHIEELKANIEQ